MRMDIQDIVAQPQHHAYLIFGYEPRNESERQYEGVYAIHTEKGLGVDEVRELYEYAFQSPGKKQRKILIHTPNISPQAQNALLKIMEEVTEGTYFFLCVPRGTEILGTLRSRCYMVDISAENEGGVSEEFTQFIAATPKNRLAIVDKMWDQGESVRHGAILRLLQDFEIHLHTTITKNKEKNSENIIRCKRVVQNLRKGIYEGALHKGTVQALAFVE